MKIEFKKIGIIDHAEIDLNDDLIIFCGPNNTGKTYATNSIYALYKFSHDDNELFFDDDLTTDIRISLEKGNSTITLTSEFVKNLIKKKLDQIKDRLPSVFASGQDFFKNTVLNLKFSDGEITKKINSLDFKVGFRIGPLLVQLTKEEGNKIVLVFTDDSLKTNPKTPENLNFIYEIASGRIKWFILNCFFEKVHITPAERTAINIFSRELSVKRNEIVDRLLEYKDSKSSRNVLREAQRYPLPIRDSLEIAEDLSNLQKNISEYEFLANQIELELLKGKINISKAGDVMFSPNKSKIKSLNIHLSASVVKSLSNLVFYFRHLAEKNDFIIIDEPELNLHPDNQIIMARIIARIVNNGFKVLISTHSDYIVKELNNLMRLKSGGDAAEPLISKYGYDSKDLLDFTKIGVYLFSEKKAVEIPVDLFGFEIRTIEQANSKLAEISENIYFGLLDKE